MTKGMTGKHHSEETKKQMRLVKLGKKLSEETKRKIGLKSLGRKHTEETKIKIGLASKGRNIGRNHTEQWKQVMREKMIGDKNPSKRPEVKKRISLSIKGEKSRFWKGGRTPLRSQIINLLEYKEWRRKIFIRDNWTCQNCKNVGGNLEVHHIKSFSIILDIYNIKTIEDAVKCAELWNTNNGITLCEKCHMRTDNYGVNLNIKPSLVVIFRNNKLNY